MVGVPKQRERTGVAPKITVAEDADPDIKRVISAFIAAAGTDPHTLRLALRNGTVLASPGRIIGEAELKNSDEKRMGAIAVLASLFETRADRWIEYDPTTQDEIRDGIKGVDPDIARSWRIDTYLGLACMALDGHTADTLPPPNPYGSLDAAA